MRLVFPGREHADVSLHPGELRLGSSAQCEVCIAGVGWLPHHATISVHPQRGLWLRLEAGVGMVHVNARPIRELALLRLGDIVSLGKIRFCVMLEHDDVIVRELPSNSNGTGNQAERVAAARAVLRGVAGGWHGRTFPLGRGVVLGSAPDADIHVEGAGLAPHHARLSLRQEQVILHALAPGNALLVNGETVEDAILHPGDQIAIEPHRFVIEAPGLPPRGGTAFTPRQRPITQTIPAIRARDVEPAQASVDEPAAKPGRSSLGWLLLAAVLIACAFGALLVFGGGMIR